MTAVRRIVLGSRSPQRLELLRSIVPAERIVVVPPRNAVEAGFDGLSTRAEIDARPVEIARAKCDDVRGQVERGTAGVDLREVAAIVTADTVIVATDLHGWPVVLGQPPDDDWANTVRRWFYDYLLGRTHVAATAVCIFGAGGEWHERVVTTEVTFHAGAERVEWYLSTGEPRGKAGGYAIQGAGGVFVSRVEGSLSNVVGLPLRELLEMLEAAGA